MIEWIKSPDSMKKFHERSTFFWLFHIPIATFLYFFFPEFWDKISVLYLVYVSQYANIVGHISSWQSVRVEKKQDENLPDV
jgi:hypothetical protein